MAGHPVTAEMQSTSASPTREVLREEVRSVLESFLTSDLRKREKLYRQESSDVEYRLRQADKPPNPFRSPKNPPSIREFTPDLRKTSTRLSPAPPVKFPSVSSTGLSPGFRPLGISGQTSIEPKSISSGETHGNTTGSSGSTLPPMGPAQLVEPTTTVDVDTTGAQVGRKKSLYKRAKQRVQESFKRHGGVPRKLPLVKSYSSQPADDNASSSAANQYDLLNRSLPMPRKQPPSNDESVVNNSRSLDYKKLHSVRPIPTVGSDSWIKNCFTPSGAQTDQNDRSSSYEKATPTDVQSLGDVQSIKQQEQLQVRNKKLRTKKWYNSLLSRIAKDSSDKPAKKKLIKKSSDSTDNRLVRFFRRPSSKRIRIGSKRFRLNGTAEETQVDSSRRSPDTPRRLANDRAQKGIAELSADAQTGLHSVTKKISRETKILHRTSGDFKALANTVDISVLSPSSSSKDSVGLLQLEVSEIQLVDPIAGDTAASGSAALNDTFNLSSNEDSKPFDTIADRLATIGDQCISALPTAQSVLAAGDAELTAVERELVEWVRRSGDTVNDRLPPEVMDALVREGLRQVLSRFATDMPMVAQLYLAFRVSSAVVQHGSDAGSTAVRQVKEACVTFIADRFSNWIVGQGGWLSAVEDSTTTDTDGG